MSTHTSACGGQSGPGELMAHAVAIVPFATADEAMALI
jgi:hypothetical protein